jgi:hypothetical protein
LIDTLNNILTILSALFDNTRIVHNNPTPEHPLKLPYNPENSELAYGFTGCGASHHPVTTELMGDN